MCGDKYSQTEISDFVEQLYKKDGGKVSYLSFLDAVVNMGNKNHNPFRHTIDRLEVFCVENKTDASGILKRVGATTEDGVPNEKFADFLKQKVA